jgi:hypothetical protein
MTADRTRGSILTHSTKVHAPDVYKDDTVQQKDHLCKLGFADPAFMLFHFLGGVSCTESINRASRTAAHTQRVLEQLPGRDNIVTDA